MAFTVYPQLKWQAPEAADLSLAEGAVNCAAAGGAALANFGSIQPALITHHAFRLKAGNPKNSSGSPLGLGTSAVEAALKAYGADATRYYGESTDIAKEALIAGYAVGIGIHYPYINANYPALSGQKTFNGEHFVSLFGWYTYAPHATVYDALFDGRCRTWGCAPNGPQRAPFRAYTGAMGQFRIVSGGRQTTVQDVYGAGKGVFIVVKPAVATGVTP